MAGRNKSPDGRTACGTVLSDTGAQRLAAAIVRLAADDYERTLARMLRKPPPYAMRRLKEEKAEAERFFLSEWFRVLVDIDGRKMIRQIQDNAVEKEKKRAMEKLEKARKQAEKKMRKGDSE